MFVCVGGGGFDVSIWCNEYPLTTTTSSCSSKTEANINHFKADLSTKVTSVTMVLKKEL